MDNDTPQLHQLMIPVLIGSFLGLIAGIIFSWNADNKPGIIGSSMVGGLFLFWWMAGWFFKQKREFGGYYEYDNATVQVAPETTNKTTNNSVTIVVHIPELNRRTPIRNMSLNEWHMLGKGVADTGKYTTRSLQDIFGASQGDSVYTRATQQLLDAGILTPAGSNGVAVTDHVGRNFFAQLKNREYEVLNNLDFPHAPLTAQESL